MDFDLRLKAITRLAQSATDAAGAALAKELQKVSMALETASEYDRLEQDLAILEVMGHRFSSDSVRVILTFIGTIESRQITYSELARSFWSEIAEYRNASTLIARAVEILVQLRYLETRSVLRALISLSGHASENVRKKADEGLRAIAGYNLKVFYGDGEQGGIGAIPQKETIEELEALKDDNLNEAFSAVLTLADGLLSPTMEGTRWSYQSLTISRGATPALPGVAEIRAGAIKLLKRLYGLAATTQDKLKVLAALSNATRTHNIGESNADATTVIAENTVDVLGFFQKLINTEDLQIVQTIESKSYWMYFHAGRDEVSKAALAIEQTIAQHAEYQIYKVLIGFEGIFVNWEELRKSDSYREDTDQLRRAKASEFALGINAQNYEEWRQRVVNYAKTESDDLAMFPVFYHFLESFAHAQPKLVLRLILEDAERIERFLIPLFRGLWAGPEQSEIKRLIESWAKEGRYLYQSTKQFLDNANLDRQVLALLLQRAAERNDLSTVALVMSVAASNFSDDKPFLIDEFFLPALEVLTEKKNANWIFDLWFRPQMRRVIHKLPDHGVDLVLRNLLHIEKIDYHTEEILYVIAQGAPEKILRFLCQRLAEDGRKETSRTFDAIPYEMHKLNEPLSKIPRDAVRTVRQLYDGDFSMFIYRGARLLKIIFPQFPPEFEAELLSIVQEGGDENLEFVLAIARNYEGQPFIHNVCRAIIRVIPPGSQYRTEVAIALQNTGVVTGAFGFAEAYEQKKDEVKHWVNDPDEKIQEFAKWYITGLDHMISADRKRAEEEVALRKHRYGE